MSERAKEAASQPPSSSMVVVVGRLHFPRHPSQLCNCFLRPRVCKLDVGATHPRVRETDRRRTLSAAAVCRLCGGIKDDDADTTVVEDGAETKPREAMFFLSAPRPLRYV